MGELIEKLGIDVGLLIAQIVNFGIVALVLWKFAYKPVVGVLDARRKKIEASIAEAERIEKERAELNIEIAKKLDEAKAEASRIIDEGKKTGTQMAAAISATAEKEYKHLLVAAERDIAAKRDEAKSELQAETTKLVVMALEAVSKETIDGKKNEAMIEKTLKEMV